MISARLLKDLEDKGFSLNFPQFETLEEEIIEILQEKNERLNLALPLLLQAQFNYDNIIKSLNKEQIFTFKKILNITSEIFKKENIKNTSLKKALEKIGKEKFTSNEFDYYYNEFKDSQNRLNENKEKDSETQLRLRSKLNTNKALSILFSPAKIRIMEKIFKHEPLSNTELKYYYRAIKPINQAILNENLHKYARIIEETKKAIF